MLERPSKLVSYRFDQLADQINKRVMPDEADVERYVGLEHLDPDSLRIRRWGDTSEVESTKLLFQPGDIIFGKRRVYQRKVAVADFEGICSAHAMVLRAKPETVLPEFLPFFMQSDLFMERALSISVGSLSPTINWKALAKEEFLLPPIQEQARLVEALSGRQHLLDRLEDALSALLSLEGSILVAQFGDRYGTNPHGFATSKLSDLAEVRTGLAKGKKASPTAVEMPYLRVANVKDGELDLSEIKEIVVERTQVERYTLHHGDVLMAEGGDFDKLGRGTVWQSEIEHCLHQNHVFAVRVDSDALDPWYLAALARSTYGKDYFRRCAKRSSNLASINKSQVSRMLVPHPSVADQREWLKIYASIRSHQQETRNRISACKALGSSILQQGLSSDL